MATFYFSSFSQEEADHRKWICVKFKMRDNQMFYNNPRITRETGSKNLTTVKFLLPIRLCK